jgi:hypothetical protein
MAGYADSTTGRNIALTGCGTGGAAELASKFLVCCPSQLGAMCRFLTSGGQDNQVQYALIRVALPRSGTCSCLLFAAASNVVN